MTEQETIDDGERVDAFLKEPAVIAAFARLEKKYFNAWRENDRTPEEREKIHNRSNALIDLATELRITSDAGKRAGAEKVRRERK